MLGCTHIGLKPSTIIFRKLKNQSNVYSAFAPMRYQCCLLPGRDPTLSWRQVNHFTCHLSFVTCHLLLVTCHLQRQCRLSTFFGGVIAENLRLLLLIFTTFRPQLCAVCLQRGWQGVPIFQQEIIWSARST